MSSMLALSCLMSEKVDVPQIPHGIRTHPTSHACCESLNGYLNDLHGTQGLHISPAGCAALLSCLSLDLLPCAGYLLPCSCWHLTVSSTHLCSCQCLNPVTCEHTCLYNQIPKESMTSLVSVGVHVAIRFMRTKPLSKNAKHQPKPNNV